MRDHGLSANATITNVDETLVSFPGHVGWETTVTVSFSDPGSGPRGVHRPRPCRWEEGRSDNPDCLRPGKADLDQPWGTDPRWVDAFFVGLGVVVWLGFSVYFGYRAWRWRENGSDDD